MKHLIIFILILLGLCVLWVYLASIRHSNIPTEEQRDAMDRFGKSVAADKIIEAILKKQSVILKGVKWRWANARLFLHLYVDSKEFDYKPVIDRIREIALSETFKFLRPIITVQFHYGAPATAPWEPFIQTQLPISPIPCRGR
ncbi:MAG: hypothetical protein A2020_11535 [Lentisphaerae bacterium GWF2_45_14]|nr:MAG: hypothetical protein A2020_11535 [Lentisphaerae bacterium GWF2_45_14]